MTSSAPTARHFCAYKWRNTPARRKCRVKKDERCSPAAHASCPAAHASWRLIPRKRLTVFQLPFNRVKAPVAIRNFVVHQAFLQVIVWSDTLLFQDHPPWTGQRKCKERSKHMGACERNLYSSHSPLCDFAVAIHELSLLPWLGAEAVINAQPRSLVFDLACMYDWQRESAAV